MKLSKINSIIFTSLFFNNFLYCMQDNKSNENITLEIIKTYNNAAETLSCDDGIVYTTQANYINIWDKSGNSLGVITTDLEAIQAIDITAAGNIAVTGNSGHVQVYDSQTKQKIYDIAATEDVYMNLKEYSPNIIWGNAMGNSMNIIDTRQNSVVATWQGPARDIYSAGVAAIPEKNTLVSSHYGNICFWDSRKSWAPIHIYDLPYGVHQEVIIDDKKLLVPGGPESGDIQIKTFDKEFCLPDSYYEGWAPSLTVELSQDKIYVLSGDTQGRLCIWHKDKRYAAAATMAEAYYTPMLNIIPLSEKYVLTTQGWYGNGFISIWDISDLNFIQSMCHVPISSIAYIVMTSSNTFATVDFSNNLRFWNINYTDDLTPDLSRKSNFWLINFQSYKQNFLHNNKN